MRTLVYLAVAGALALPASATIVLDGLRDVDYGAALAVQTVETQFGDANPAGGSELDAGYARVEGSMLYIMLTGNLEANFNKLNVFIDSVAGGQNTLQNADGSGGNNPTNDGWAGKYAGFTFDTGFEADYMIILSNGNFGGNQFNIDYVVIGGGAAGFEAATDVFGGSLTGTTGISDPLGNGIGVAFNNSNTLGVAGGTAAANQANAAAVATGIELAIPLAVLGGPAGPIRVSAMLNGSNHDYLSNQFLGGLLPAPRGNLGGDGAGGFNGTVGQLNLNNATYASGDQFFVIPYSADIPEPSTLSLMGGALAALALWRRRRS